MSTIRIAGDAGSALSHFALYGLAAIGDEAGLGPVTMWWTMDAQPKPMLDLGTAEPIDLARAFHDVIQKLGEDGEWPSLTVEYGAGAKKSRMSPFSPRIKAIDAEKNPDDWPRHQKARHAVLDRLTADGRYLDLALIKALGEAAYWRTENKDPRPDHGASRWEMKTRNRGEEFVQHRFLLMVSELAKWSVEEILEGISGAKVRDTLANNPVDSRTSTGFTPPGAADVALSFAALTGISMFPMAHRVHHINVTPGAYPTRVLHPTAMVLPVPTIPLRRERLSGILLSKQLAFVVEQVGTMFDVRETDVDAAGEIKLEAARKWLTDRGVPGVVRFPIFKGGSASAPERQALAGTVVPHGR